MPSTSDDVPTQYSTLMGLVFIFNLIIGTGALAMPKAFQEAGYVFGIVAIAFLAFMSYVSLTFVVESMSAANALLQSQRAGKLKLLAIQFASDNGPSRTNSSDRLSTGNFPSTPSVHRVPALSRPQFFEITHRVEFGKMASIFLTRWGVRCFYACLIIYLYGDLSIYATAVPKSMMNVVCTYRLPTDGQNASICSTASNLTSDMPCWTSAAHFWTRFTIYRLFVGAFALLIGPWVFFNVSKTKYLQTFSTASRWIAFLLMISVASWRLTKGDQAIGHPPLADFKHFGNLFGICVYAFMCHHSLPSVVTPMKSKTHLFPLTAFVYVLILSFYIALSTTGSFAFANVMDVYTLNFLHPCSDSGESPAAHSLLVIVEYFLALFPVFTLSMTFPVVGITLRNNIQGLLFPHYGKSKPKEDQEEDKETLEDPAESILEDTQESTSLIQTESAVDLCLKLAHNFVVPCMVLLIPLSIALATDNVEILTSITGSYAGVGVQYAMPSLLVWSVRKRLPQMLGESVPNQYTSPFKHPAWVVLVFLWAVLTVLVVTVNHIFSGL